MFGLGFGEILVVAVMALVFIGPKKLPEVARTLGKFWKDFQDSIHGIKEEMHHELAKEETPEPVENETTQKVDQDNLPSA